MSNVDLSSLRRGSVVLINGLQWKIIRIQSMNGLFDVHFRSTRRSYFPNGTCINLTSKKMLDEVWNIEKVIEV